MLTGLTLVLSGFGEAEIEPGIMGAVMVLLALTALIFHHLQKSGVGQSVQ